MGVGEGVGDALNEKCLDRDGGGERKRERRREYVCESHCFA